MIEAIVYFTCVMWWALITHAWHVVLIPFWIGSAIGLYRKNIKYPLIGLGISWWASWMIAFVSIFFIRF